VIWRPAFHENADYIPAIVAIGRDMVIVGAISGVISGAISGIGRWRRAAGRPAGVLAGMLIGVLVGMGAALQAAPAVAAAASAWQTSDHADLRLISAVEATGGAETIPLGLEFRLAPGWKIYWRSPGDAGYPPRITWLERANLAAAEIKWPAPHRFSVLGLETMGYEGTVVLPLEARLERPGEPLALVAQVDYLACSEICVPHEATLALSLPAGPARPSEFVHAIDRFNARVPGRAGAGEIAIERATLVAGAKPELRIAAVSRSGFVAPDVFIEGPDGYFFGAPRVAKAASGQIAELAVPVGLARDAAPDRLLATPLTFTLVDGAGERMRAIEVSLTPGAGQAGLAGVSGLDGLALALALAAALLGGLILNLMPCVLPVLSLKLLSVVRLGGADRARVRSEFLASSAGILASFMLLAGAAIGLRQAGLAVGWGMQFQEPVFLLFMVAVLVLFAANLWGLFAVHLPGTIGDRVAAPGADRPHLVNAFFTGAFATLLATPCSAPFLGTAVGYALSQGGPETLAIFAVLGLGLALPYLAVAAWPRLVARLPRPGRWMIGVQRVMGIALAGTALWLVSVLAASAGAAWAALALGLGLAAVAAFALGTLKAGWRRASGVAALALLVAVVTLPPALLTRSSAELAAGSDAPGTAVPWQPFDRAEIPALVAAGKTVVVDVTADWCVTCLVNKRLVLDQGQVTAWLGRPEVAPRRADWTRPNDAIAAYLASFGRYGIPFNAVYGPGAPQGIVLPEVLTPDVVLAALRRAAGGT